QGIKCEGNIGNPALERGLKWLNDNFDQVTRRQPYYALYGVERIGVASGRKYFGTTDWYEFGVDYLLPKQNKQGGQWGTLPNTAFALGCLARGSAPVAINKLQYELEGLKAKQESHWTQRPRDTANVVHWMGTQIERPLNWQIINLQVAAAAMHDAPI